MDQLRSIRMYDKVLDVLDESSWSILKHKAKQSFLSGTGDRGKQEFFNQLNEAFAYRHLLQRGYSSVAFMPEDNKQKTPDLQFTQGDFQRFCEVKTLSISNEEIDRMKRDETFDSSIYIQLPDALLQNKLYNVLTRATKQIQSQGTGFVYLIVYFDDFTLRHYTNYKRQLIDFLEIEFPALEVYIKIGIQSRKHIHHRSSHIRKRS